MGAVVQQKGEALETPAQRPGEAGGPALARQQEGLELPRFGWEAGQHTQGTACGTFGPAPPFPMSHPSLQVIPPALSALDTV